MNSIRLISACTIGLGFMFACKTARQPVSAAPAPSPVATATATASDSVKPGVVKTRPVYHESNRRLNDLLHTRLDVSFDWQKTQLIGKATMSIRPYFYPVDELFLDARGMDIKSVKVLEQIIQEESGSRLSKDGGTKIMTRQLADAKFVYRNDSILVNLSRFFSAAETYTVEVEYVAKPNELRTGGSSAITEDKGLYFINPSGENPFRMPQVWTQGETQASSAWFPTIDSPNERMTQEIFMTVDEKYTTLSNGVLVKATKGPDGKRTDHWKLDQPHAPYLAMMAVGEFVKVTDSPWQGKEVSYYVEKEYASHAKAMFGATPEMIDFYSRRLGVPYPWDKYAQIVVRDYVSGAMENTSATLHGDFMVYQTTRETIDGVKGEAVIAHELFHQWFGDLVTIESWSNLPLNESFATYGEYMWYEYKHGRDAADYHHWQSRQGYLHSEKEVDLIRFDYRDKEDMFDAFSYNKGGQVLHMLRKVVGDSAFFLGLKNYLESNKFKSVEIHNLRLAMEETSGMDLNWFFNQWFLNKGRPKLAITEKYDQQNKVLVLQVQQNQDLTRFPVYRLPLFVDLYIEGKAQRSWIVIDSVQQTFRLPATAQPGLVNFDAERQLLADIDFKKSTQQYLFQYQAGPLMGDRLEALRALENEIAGEEAFKVFVTAAQSDRFDAIRNYAISRLEKVPGERAGELKPALLFIYKNDVKTTTRAAALRVLAKRFSNDGDVQALIQQAFAEKSFAICREALEALGKIDPKQAVQKAATFEKENSKEMLFTVANLYANHGNDENLQFLHEGLKLVSGFEVMSYLGTYAKLAKKSTEPKNVLMAANDIVVTGKGANRFVSFAATKALRDLITAWEAHEKSLQAEIEGAKAAGKNSSALQAQLDEIRKTATELQQLQTRLKS